MATQTQLLQRVIDATNSKRLRWRLLTESNTWEAMVDVGSKTFVLHAGTSGAVLRQIGGVGNLAALAPGAALDSLLAAIASQHSMQDGIDALYNALG